MRHRLFVREVIGHPQCPILHRWTLLALGRRPDGRLGRWGKMLLHHFLPNSDDRDVHDHPWPFITIVLKGFYVNIERNAQGKLTAERMKPGTIRYRPATHTHCTKAGPNGCWTLVVTGPLVREWGFWLDGKWRHWRDYEALVGYGMRCDD